MIRELARGTAIPLVLRILAAEPQHGYGILQAIRERTGAEIEFTEGTIYPLLHSLESEGLVTAHWAVAPSGRDRKVYAISETGRRRLDEAVREWHRFSKAVDRALGTWEVAL